MRNKYPDFWSVLIGSEPIGFLLGYIALAVLAAFIITLWNALKKYQEAQGTPDKWSWKYFFWNNIGNFIVGILLIPLFIRIEIEFFDHPGLMLLFSVGTGFGFYKLAKVANRLGLWTTNSLSKKISEKIKSNEKDQ